MILKLTVKTADSRVKGYLKRKIVSNLEQGVVCSVRIETTTYVSMSVMAKSFSRVDHKITMLVVCAYPTVAAWHARTSDQPHVNKWNNDEKEDIAAFYKVVNKDIKSQVLTIHVICS